MRRRQPSSEGGTPLNGQNRIDASEYPNVSELYRTGDWILHVVVQFPDPTDSRTYRLFAKRRERPPEGAQAESWDVAIDEARRVRIVVGRDGVEEKETWCPLRISGVFEGATPEEALRHALSSLNSIGAGSQHDEESRR